MIIILIAIIGLITYKVRAICCDRILLMRYAAQSVNSSRSRDPCLHVMLLHNFVELIKKVGDMQEIVYTYVYLHFASRFPWPQINILYRLYILCTPSSAELVNVIIIIISAFLNFLNL